MDEAEHHDGYAAHQHDVVPKGKGHRVGTCPQQGQKWPVKYRHEHGQNHAGSQGYKKAGETDPPRAISVLLAQQPRDPLAVDVAEGH